jgi:surfeit locus 1 family protein
VILVNRGFVPSERADPATRDPVEGQVTITGLQRLSEPGRSMLRSNQHEQDRWFCRTVAGIARAAGCETPPLF